MIGRGVHFGQRDVFGQNAELALPSVVEGRRAKTDCLYLTRITHLGNEGQRMSLQTNCNGFFSKTTRANVVPQVGGRPIGLDNDLIHLNEDTITNQRHLSVRKHHT